MDTRRSLLRARSRRGTTPFVLLAAALPLLLSVVAVAPANAAAPSNNTVAGATLIPAVPGVYHEDTTGATGSASDGKCVRGASVWFKMRPSATTRLRVVTAGSDYDTMIAVFTGTRRHRTLVGCNDDGIGLSAAVQQRFVAGHRYWIAVSACCSRQATGGHAVLTVYRPAPAGVTATVDTVESGGISGRLIVSGTVTCPTPSAVDIPMVASQRIDGNVARGYGELYLEDCTSTPQDWSVRIDSDTGWAFEPGQLALSYQETAFDGFSYVENPQQDVVKTVVDNPNQRVRP